MMKYDKNKLFENIDYYANKKGYTLTEMEHELSISAGYLSKLKKNDVKPSIDLIAKIAEILGVTIDELIYVQHDKLNEDEETLLAFLKKLIDGTSSGQYYWQESSGHLELFLDDMSLDIMDMRDSNEYQYNNSDLVMLIRIGTTHNDLCSCMLNDNDPIGFNLSLLYDLAYVSSAHIVLDDDVRNVLEKFIK